MLVLCYDFLTDDQAAQVLEDKGFELTDELRHSVKLRSFSYREISELTLSEQEQEIYEAVIKDLPDMETHQDSESPVDYLGWLVGLSVAAVMAGLAIKHCKGPVNGLLQVQKRNLQ
jgi:hypothetical protein